MMTNLRRGLAKRRAWLVSAMIVMGLVCYILAVTRPMLRMMAITQEHGLKYGIAGACLHIAAVALLVWSPERRMPRKNKR